MPWNKHDYPVSMKNLEPRVRNKAIDIANALLDDGYEEGRAISIATAQAEKWNDDHPSSHSSSGADVHIVSHEDSWALKQEGKDKPLSTFDTKQEALDKAKDFSSKHHVNTVIHGENGKIQTTKSYS